MQYNIAGLRKEYSQKILSETSILPDPVQQFDQWWQEAIASKIEEVNAMTLATASIDGLPSARTVLLKGFSENGFIFFSNYESYKGKQLAENPRACLLFFWKELERQVRIVGIVQKINGKESDTYFHSRPVSSQIGAIVSPQSSVIENRDWLENKYNEIQQKISPGSIQRPVHWGGYIIKPALFEFWQGRPSRLHDRIEYSLLENGAWKIQRLAP
jgi:pyridoxamine 5'-phosphate oxidase